jgi:choline dehydrogenase-like flavoprotein
VLASVAHIGDGFSATLLASGASGHLMGSHRMGASDDGESVADAHGRVWNYDNLHLAGNGLANGWSVCNPTLTTVALGLRVADSIRAVAAGAPERAAVA